MTHQEMLLRLLDDKQKKQMKSDDHVTLRGKRRITRWTIDCRYGDTYSPRGERCIVFPDEIYGLWGHGKYVATKIAAMQLMLEATGKIRVRGEVPF